MNVAKGTTKPGVLIETERAQAAASDPGASAWVGANAGAGKTHVLKMRVLRLLLAGTRPERILCLTYTKAAAAEMSARVFAELATWSTTNAADLSRRLRELLGRAPSGGELALARQLFARAIETPGGLKIDTIHAFCERLLQRFPLEAGVPPGFEIVDDVVAGELVGDAIRTVLQRATADPSSALGRALAIVVARVQGEEFDRLIGEAIGKRYWLEAISRLGLLEDDAFEAAAATYRRGFGLLAVSSEDRIEAAMLSAVPDDLIADALRALRASDRSTDQAIAADLSLARAAPTTSQRIDALASALLTGEREPRSDKRFITAAVRRAEPGITDRLTAARDRFAALMQQRDLSRAIDTTMGLARVADAILQEFADAKARRAALDFDDLIQRTAGLISNPDQASWVLYKLDGGLDHILVDEAQDTSPRQWSIVEALAQAFFENAPTGDAPHTVFAVGDEKQSIYSFQGAAPHMFAEVGRRFEKMSREARLEWRRVPLELSFRTVAPVLDVVDRVFSDPGRTPGLTAAEGSVHHIPLRVGEAGLVEVWPVEVPDPPIDIDAFDPLAEQAAGSPVRRVASRIADRIGHWLRTGEELKSQGRPIRPGDIIVLVRSRRPFAPVMVAELKKRGIPVAGADRMLLDQQIAVQDLLALGRVLLLPEDDLALAAVLKSPLFDLDDDDLMAIAPGRKGSLYRALLEGARTMPRLAEAAALLKRWRGRADFLPPYEFLAEVLDEGGMRRRLLARLGVDAAEAIDELQALALAYDDASPPSLQGFLATFESIEREIKRDMEHGRDEVRVMTVHAAKGLEAPIVFLPDTCKTSSGGTSRLLPVTAIALPGSSEAAWLWSDKHSARHPGVVEAKAETAERDAQERNRLLYVAMTRARDRLYVAGFEGARARRPECWYDLITAGIGSALRDVEDETGRIVRRLEADQTVAVATRPAADVQDVGQPDRPAWLEQPAGRELRPSIPLAPSRLAPLEIDDEGEPRAVEPRAGSALPPDEPLVPAAPSPFRLAGDQRFLRGTLTHALLEHLPRFPAGQWDTLARKFVAERARGLSERFQRSVAAEALTVLRDPTFGHVFGPGSRAEVPIVADLAHPTKPQLPKIRISGQIDRLVHRDGEVLIVDYKTNRPPPQDVAHVPLSYLIQVAAYRIVLKEIFPDHLIRAAFVWTDGGTLMPIEDQLLDAREADVWGLATSRLDAAGVGS